MFYAHLSWDDLRTSLSQAIADPHGVLVINETGFLKKGRTSVGGQRQSSGAAGRIENCQVGVFLSHTSSRGHTLLDRAWYLPKSWTDDPERCPEAHGPAEVPFATKPELAQRMLGISLHTPWVYEKPAPPLPSPDCLYLVAHPVGATSQSKGEIC
jgi:hypothetical protein